MKEGIIRHNSMRWWGQLDSIERVRAIRKIHRSLKNISSKEIDTIYKNR